MTACMAAILAYTPPSHSSTTSSETWNKSLGPSVVVLALRTSDLADNDVMRLQHLSAALRESLRAHDWMVWSAEATKAWMNQTQLGPSLSIEVLRTRIHRANKDIAPTDPLKAVSYLDAGLRDLRRLTAPTLAHLALEQETRIRAAQLCQALDMAGLAISNPPDEVPNAVSHLREALFATPDLMLSDAEYGPKLRSLLEQAQASEALAPHVAFRIGMLTDDVVLYREGQPIAQQPRDADRAFPSGPTRLGIQVDGRWVLQGRYLLDTNQADLHLEPWAKRSLWLEGPGLVIHQAVAAHENQLGHFRGLFPSEFVMLVDLRADQTNKLVRVSFHHATKLSAIEMRRSSTAELNARKIIQDLSREWRDDATAEDIANAFADELSALWQGSGDLNPRVAASAEDEHADTTPSNRILAGLLGVSLGSFLIASALGGMWYVSSR